jgi:hypothetical protein
MSYLTRATAPVAPPADVADLLQRFRLTVPGLLTDSNPKLNKGDGRAVILHHLPARALAAAITLGTPGSIPARSYLPGLAALAEAEGLTAAALAHNGCPWASNGCGGAGGGCLVWAGHGGLSPVVAEARGRRTLAMLADPVAYGRAVLWAIAWHHRRAAAAGQRLAVRLRGTDEGPGMGWHRLRVTVSHAETVRLSQRFGLHTVTADALTGGATLADLAGHAVSFYDYSKAHPVTGPLSLTAQAAAGWDITASLRADAADAAGRAVLALRAGFRLAVPVAINKGQPLPQRLTLNSEAGAVTVPCVDGDAHDHRYRDPAGVAVILRAKRARGADPAVAAPFFLSAPASPAPGDRFRSALPDGEAFLSW